MTAAALLLTLDVESAAAGANTASREPLVSPAGFERFCKLLDTHAICASWLVHAGTAGHVIGAIRAMRTRQDVLARPQSLSALRPGIAFTTRIHPPTDFHGKVEPVWSTARGRPSREWMPRPLRLVAFRAALDRAIRSGMACHVHFGLSELQRRPGSIRLFEDLLFHIAEERRARRIRIVNASDTRKTAPTERVTVAA